MMKIRFFMQDHRGSMQLSLIILLGIIVGIGGVVTEVLRVHGIQEHLSDELYRASNLAIKTAMYDSWRIDHISRFDEDTAMDAFYDYLQNELKLTANNEKIVDGKVQYKLVVNNISVNGVAVRMHVEATAYSTPIFRFLDFQWELPINVTSRNMRVD